MKIVALPQGDLFYTNAGRDEVKSLFRNRGRSNKARSVCRPVVRHNAGVWPHCGQLEAATGSRVPLGHNKGLHYHERTKNHILCELEQRARCIH